MSYWESLEELVEKHEIVIDRLKGTPHPEYPDFIYTVDYGYLKDTTTIDGNGVDILKNDAEIKIIYGCTEKEIRTTLRVLNEKYMRAIYVKRNYE